MIKHQVSKQALEKLEKVMFAQDEVGVKKYNEPVHYMLPYDWEQMADEEMADYMKYRECERQRKEDAIFLLEKARTSENPLTEVEGALHLLTLGRKEKDSHEEYLRQMREFGRKINPKPSDEEIEELRARLIARRNR